MTDTPKGRVRGRPPKEGGFIALTRELDQILRALPDTTRAALAGRRAVHNKMLEDPAQVAETLRRDRASILESFRPARSRKRTEEERAAIQKRSARLSELPELIAAWPAKSASYIAKTLQGRGFFTDIATGTLRKDIATLRNLAGPVK